MEFKEYVVVSGTGYKLEKLLHIFQEARDTEERIWSARIGTGLLGKPDCRSGKHGPGGKTEVLFGQGDDGLKKIVNLGFIPCPTCKPEETPGFKEVVVEEVEQKYDIPFEDFADKKKLSFDPRKRLKFEEIFNMTGGPSNRIYVPENLSEAEQDEFKEELEALNVTGTAVGSYDRVVHFKKCFEL